ncbi:MAG: DegT/DnrJ/EryC1/StrS family aminotransferase [Symbiobacteriia bacterium]
MTQIQVPLFDAAAQAREIEPEMAAAAQRVLQSGRYILGDEVEAFEGEVARWLGACHAVGVASGTDALLLSLIALGIGPGEEVITTPYSFVATATAIVRAGATPVFVDIDPVTFNMDPDRAAAAIGPHTRAILPVHLFGHPADMRALRDLADRHGLALLEDACQAFGARMSEDAVGGLGHAGCFSFFPSKNLGGAGDGGLVVTDDEALADHVRRLRNHGSGRERYVHQEIGFTSRLDALQAAILRVKLGRVEGWNERRRSLAALYDELLSGLPLRVPEALPGCHHVYHVYCIRSPRRDALRDALQAAGVETAVYYSLPLHRQPALQGCCRVAGDLIETEKAARTALALPIHPHLSRDELARVASVIRRVSVEPGEP